MNRILYIAIRLGATKTHMSEGVQHNKFSAYWLVSCSECCLSDWAKLIATFNIKGGYKRPLPAWTDPFC